MTLAYSFSSGNNVGPMPSVSPRTPKKTHIHETLSLLADEMVHEGDKVLDTYTKRKDFPVTASVEESLQLF